MHIMKKQRGKPRLPSWCAIGLVWLLSASAVFAAGTSGADVLRLKLEARAWSLGMSGTPLLELGGTSAYNPAALGFSRRPSIGFLHFFAFPDVSCEQLSVRRYVGPLGTMAGELLHRHQEPIDNLKGEAPFYVSDTVLGLYCGRGSGGRLFYGMGLKGIILRLGDVYAYGFAVDIGAIYRLPELFDVGLAIRNAGPGVKFDQVADPLPLEINCGIARGFSIYDERGIVNAVVDLSLGREGEVGLGLGVEGGQRGSWLLRAGYRLERGRTFSDGPSVGFGLDRDFKVFRMKLDYCCKLVFFELGGYDYEPEHLLGFTVFIGSTGVVGPGAEEGNTQPVDGEVDKNEETPSVDSKQ